MTDPSADIANPPGLRRLTRRLLTQPDALRMLRATLSADSTDPLVQSLAWAGTDDPSVALLDAWATVVDTVCFYNDRIANEGFLRTATEHRFLRELARGIGEELRPGVAAEADLAFFVETALEALDAVTVPAGTPVQSVPAANERPQTFETDADLEARAAWNKIAGVDGQSQTLAFGTSDIWVRPATVLPRVGDHVLVVGAERAASSGAPSESGDAEKWDFRSIETLDDSRPGWLKLGLDRPIGYHRDRELVAQEDVHVLLLREQARLFGYNAPQPALLSTRNAVASGSDGTNWTNFEVASGTLIELAGDHPTVLPDTWIVLSQPDAVEAYRVVKAEPGGAAKFAVSGPLTQVELDVTAGLSEFSRWQASAFLQLTELDATQAPIEGTYDGTTVCLSMDGPPLPAKRAVLLVGTAGGNDQVVGATVVDSTANGDGTVDVSFDSTVGLDRAGLVVFGNVVHATHGESSPGQPLGSGDGRQDFQSFALRRQPLTFVRDPLSEEGASPALDVSVNGVTWARTEDVSQAAPHDRVYAVLRDENGGARVVFGDGMHGARLPSGQENVTAQYRIGIGSPGSVTSGQLSLLPRRPFGIRSVINPAPSRNWADEETLEDARTTAPQHVRTLARVVSVADHEDVARAFPGVGEARADLVWDGHRDSVVVSVLGANGAAPGSELLADLSTHIAAQTTESDRFAVLAGQRLWFGVRVEVAIDTGYAFADVQTAVSDALDAAFGPTAAGFATAVSRAEVLVAVRDVAGVVACTVPRLLEIASVPDPPSVAVVPPDPTDPAEVIVAAPGRFDVTFQAAQSPALAPGASVIEVMST